MTEPLTLGQLQARAEKITDRDELKAFIESAPLSLQLRIKQHLQTVWAIKKYHQSQKKDK